jgi:predicted nucleic acid-binding Zn ribbon protein
MENNLADTNAASCPSCGEGNENENQFCVHCGNPLPRRRRIRFTSRYILFAVISLILAGAISYVLAGGLESKLVGKVNGEGITRKEFSMRLERAKKFYELRYGQNLFDGEEGKENLNRLKTEVLDEMTTEKILFQEAKSAGYASAPEEEIVKQAEAIKGKYGLSDADLKQKIGGGIEDLKEELRKGWIISRFVEKAVLKGDQQNAQLLFAQWFANAKAKANIETYEKLKPISTARASCCRNGCGGGTARALDPKIEADAKAKGLEYYQKKTQKRGASARVTDFGCHIQVDIIENGKVVVSLTYKQGEVQEI